MNNIIVGMGEALWDVLPEGKKIGGAPANFAYHVSQFGFDSRVVSAVGNDELGDEIMKVFKEKQLKTQIERADSKRQESALVCDTIREYSSIFR